MPFRKRVSVGFFTTLGCLLSATCAFAKPSGFHLKAGHALPPVQKNGTFLIESGDHAVIDWDHFSIDHTEHVVFQQLHESSAVLNRVTGVDQSELLGQLSSNGKVYLVNPNGILIGPEARIETAGFIASTLDLLDQDLSGGVLSFAGESEASVINQGVIHCPAGDVFLIGKTVESSGQIKTLRGRQGLVSGCEVVIRPTGAPQIRIRSEEEIESKMLEENPFALAIRHSGELEGEEVYLLAEEGLCEVKGAIAATRAGVGGVVQVLGDVVHLLDGTEIDASGEKGGGEILVGGDYQGKNRDIKNAQMVWVGKETLVKADALESGNGGKVILWADRVTCHHGRISARGGPKGGNGGFVEISAPYIEPRGVADLTAPQGKWGTILYDPDDVTISTSSTTGGVDLTTNPVTLPNSASVTINTTDLVNQLAVSNVKIDNTGTSGGGTGFISVSSAFTWSANTNLTLVASAYINIAATVTNNSSSTGFTAVTLVAYGTGATSNNGISFNAGVTTTGGDVIVFGIASTAANAGSGVRFISGGIATGSGNIYVAGAVPSGSTTTSIGVRVDAANFVQSSSGAIFISGTSLASGVSSSGFGSGAAWNAGATTAAITLGSTINNPVGGSPASISGCVGGTGSGCHGVSYTGGGITFNGDLIATNNIIANGSGSSGFVAGSGNIVCQGSGNIQITASSNASGAGNHGVAIIAGTLSATTGTITLQGTSSASSTSASNGIQISGTGKVSTTSGNIVLEGTVPSGAKGASHGVLLNTANAIISTSGNISLSGVTNADTAVSLHGVYVASTWTTGSPTATTGTVTFYNCKGSIKTTPSGASNSNGIEIAAAFTTGGNVVATDRIVGGNGGSAGLHANSAITLQNSGSSITIAATNAGVANSTLWGILLDGSGTITTNNGNVTLVGDSSTTSSTTGGAAGVALLTKITAGNGTINIGGKSPGGSGANYGVYLNSATASCLSTTGPVNISGVSISSGASAHGVNVGASTTTGTSGTMTFGTTISAGSLSISGCQGGSGGTSHGINIGATFSTTGSVVATQSIQGGSSGGAGFNASATFSVTGSGSSINIAATGSSTASGSNGIAITAGTLSTTGGGTIVLAGTSGAGSSGASHGVSISGGAVSTSTGSGNISITGTATMTGSGAVTNYGVNIGGGVVSTTGVGNISITGNTSGAGSATNRGIFFNTANGITAGSGNITLNGTSTSSSSSGNQGIEINLGWSTGCSGTLTLTGQGGNNSEGVRSEVVTVTHPGNLVITATAGTNGMGMTMNQTIISVTGATNTINVNATGNGSGHGFFTSSGTIRTTGTGTTPGSTPDLTIIGTGGASGSGMFANSSQNFNITTVTGNISLTGSLPSGGTGAAALFLMGTITSTSASTPGTVTISGDASAASGSSIGVSNSSGLGNTITGSTIIFTNCKGGSGSSSHGIAIGSSNTTLNGDVVATNNIIGGSGSDSVGFTCAAAFAVQGTGKTLAITATSTATTGAGHGISLTGGTMSTNGGGSITLNGTGGNSIATSHGVNISSTARVSTTTAGTGAISITGIARGTSTAAGVGVNLASSAPAITSPTGGAITISGTSSAPGTGAHGVSINTNSWTTSTSGLVTFTNCTGGSGPGSHGIHVGTAFSTTGSVVATNTIRGGTGSGSIGFNQTANFIASGSGSTITITASSQATAGTAHGISITGGAISTSGGGSITLNGTSGASSTASYGVNLATANPITSPIGAINVTGISTATVTGSHGILWNTTWATGGSGTVTLGGTAGSTGASYVTSLGGNFTTSGGALLSTGSNLLATAITIDTTNAGAVAAGASITFNGTIDADSPGGRALTLTAGTGGTATLGGDVGGANRLGNLTISSGAGFATGTGITSIQANNFTVAASIPTTLNNSGAVNINTSGFATGSISFGGTMTGNSAGGQALTLTSHSAGGVTLSGNVGATRLGALTIVPGSLGLSIGSSVTSIAANSFTLTGNQPTVFNNTAALTLDTSGFNGNILFQGPINGTTAGMQSVALTAGTGTVTLSQAVGGSTPLGAFSVTASQINPAANINTKAGVITLTGPVTLAGDLTISSAIGAASGADITFSSTITGAQGLTVAAGSSGIITLGGAVGTLGTPLTSLNLSGAQLRLGNNIYTDGGPLVFVIDTVLTGSPTINTDNQDLTFSGTIDGTNASEQSLTLQAGAGAITLSDTIGGTVRLGDLSIATASGLSLGSSVRANSLTVAASIPTTLSLVGLTTIDTTGAISFGGILKGTVDGQQPLTLLAGSGNVTFSGTVGVGKRLGALTVSTAAGVSLPATVAANSVTISSPIPTTLSASTTLIDTSAVNGSITLGGTVIGTMAGAQALTLTPGAGSITLGNAVGLGTALGAISIPSVNNLTASSSIIASSLTQTTGSGTSTFNGELNLSGALSLTGNNFTINRPVSATNVAITNTGTLSIGSSGDMDLTGAFTQSGGGTVQTAGSVTTAGGNIHWTDAVNLTGNVVFDTGESTGEIRFYSTVDGEYGLRLFANEVQFDDVVGGTTDALGSLRVTAETITLGGDQTVASGPMLYDGAVILRSDTTLLDSGLSGMSFQTSSTANSTSSITGNYDLTLRALNASITVEGDIDLSGTSGSAGGSLTAAAGTGFTCAGQILTEGGSASPGTGGAGGDVSITCSAGSISIHNINVSGGDGTVVNGNGGDILLQPSSGYSGDYPIGIVILNEDLSLNQDGNLVSLAGSGSGAAGTRGTMTVSANRSSPSKVATVVSSSSGNDVFITGGDLTLGTYEAITILGDLLIMCNTVSLGDAVALDALVILSMANNLNLHDPYDILDSSGNLYSSPTLHYLGGSDYLRVGTQNPISNNLNGQNLELSSSTFRPLLFYNGHILNYDTSPRPTPTVLFVPLGFQQFALYQLAIADAQLSDLLPIYPLPLSPFYTIRSVSWGVSQK